MVYIIIHDQKTVVDILCTDHADRIILTIVGSTENPGCLPKRGALNYKSSNVCVYLNYLITNMLALYGWGQNATHVYLIA